MQVLSNTVLDWLQCKFKNLFLNICVLGNINKINDERHINLF